MERTKVMKKLLLFVFVFIASFCSAQNVLDLRQKSILDFYYLQAISNSVSATNIADGSITEDKLAPDFMLLPTQILNTGLTQQTTFFGPNISGKYDSLVIVGLYPNSNPSNFINEAFLIGNGYITGAQVPSFETDPTVVGLNVTNTWLSASNKVTNVQVFLNGLLTSWTSNGVALP
jgi:hypothetical protein